MNPQQSMPVSSATTTATPASTTTTATAAVAPAEPAPVDPVVQCFARYGSREPGDGKCSVKVNVNGDMDLNMYEAVSMMAPPNAPFMDGWDGQFPVTNEDTLSLSMNINNAHECMKMFRCVKDAARMR